ncbi:MAG: DUF885 domain-containing protein [Chloroflexi bacterium]|nr:DUF885 domain-containing protein [Chloroflexota bacterium]
MTTLTDQSTLETLADDYWRAFLARHPVFATAVGAHEHDDRLDDESPAAREAWRHTLADFERRLADAPDGDEITRAALHEALLNDRALLDADMGSFNVDPMDGPQVALLNIPSFQPHESDEDARRLLERWRAMPAALDQAAANLVEGRDAGRTGVRMLCTKAIEQLDELIARPIETWPLVEVAAELAGIRDDVHAVVRDEILPAFARYRDVIANELAPHARPDDRPGVMHVPGGEATYQALSRAHTSLDLAPERVHAIGLDEIARIDEEFVTLGGELLGTGDLHATLTALRDDPALHFTTREEIAETARASLARANEAVPEWFGRLPKAPCEVVVMPAHEEKHSTIAYYREPSPDGSRPGQYFINTYAPETRPRYEAETLAFHESVPGHHLQIAIAQELDHIPDFRRFLGSTAFVEGWGLYTERLSEEMGLLSSEMDRFGVLSFDAWRASRLVVDTGMHALGWTRPQAIDFMRAHTALGDNNITNEVDRYIAWPGQALAYKLGQLEILRLRSEARERQGERFEISRFHDAVLGEGAPALPVLRRIVERALP